MSDLLELGVNPPAKPPTHYVLKLNAFEREIDAAVEKIFPLVEDVLRRMTRRPSTISRMMAARRARARKSKPLASETDGVHRAISAMQKPGRANEL